MRLKIDRIKKINQYLTNGSARHHMLWGKRRYRNKNEIVSVVAAAFIALRSFWSHLPRADKAMRSKLIPKPESASLRGIKAFKTDVV